MLRVDNEHGDLLTAAAATKSGGEAVGDCLRQLLLPARCIPEAYFSLRTMGISASTLFPDLPGAAKDAATLLTITLFRDKITEIPDALGEGE